MAPKLSYFNFKGAAEPSRLAFVVGGIEFEDHRFTREEWAELKPKTPYGQVPTLEVDGELYAQSDAILRYVGKLGGTYPSDPLLALKVDMTIDAVKDMAADLSPTMKEPDQEKKMAARKVLAEIVFPKWLAIFNKQVEDNGSGYMVGDSLTIADFKVYAVLVMLQSGMLDGIPTSIVNDYPALTELVKKVSSNEKIAAYEAKLNAVK
mmetsp:Transcript_17642/g.49314  ORF Transcript_17642/g.49314 Transcript_17642/m.49314 type:complete len:207 (+) Transcript_17642:108-728(+)